jgi:transcriptional regulator with XRE-family HTH domain
MLLVSSFFLGGGVAVMRIAELFREARKAKGLKQAEIASECAISRSALARFETGSLNLSEETLLHIAPLLDIDPDFLIGNSKIPFKNQDGEIIKFLIDKYHVTTDLLLTTILTKSDRLDIFYLSPPLTIVERIRHLNIADNPTYALLIRDEVGNIYLFRCKSPKDFLDWEGTLSVWFSRHFQLTSKPGYFQKRIISRDLYIKISNFKDVTRADLEFLFNQQSNELFFKEFVLSEAEKKVIIFMREKHIDGEDLILKFQQ